MGQASAGVVAEPSRPRDLIVQFQLQTHAYRFMLIHQSKALFPDGFGTEAEELGKHSSHKGPCLTLLKHVTRPKEEVTEWLQNCHLHWAIMRIYWLEDDTAPDVQTLVETLRQLPPPDGPVRLQCFPRNLEEKIGTKLPESWDLQPVGFAHLLDIVLLDDRLRYFLRKESTLFRSTALTPPRQAGAPSRAPGKLEEALLMAAWTPPPGGGAAIDVGAAPGGWTAALASRVKAVVAVDPAVLDPAVSALPNVAHVRDKAENAGAEIDAALRSLMGQGGREGEALAASAPLADVLVSDMNCHPVRMFEIVEALLPRLKSGGMVILTLKFFSRSRRKTWSADGIEGRPGSQLRDVRVAWLMANTVFERTCIAYKV